MGSWATCKGAFLRPDDGAENACRVHEVLGRWGPAYLERHGAAMPRRQREVLETLLRCRTPALGGSLHHCPGCGLHHFSYHSCNDRHCPRCGGDDAEAWLEANRALLLPTPYFLVTFTVPEPLRRWLRSHPALGYDLLFAASAQALQELAQNPKRLGASLGMLGVLHTWSRQLVYHPHVHYLVPGGGLSLDERSWVPSRTEFLVRVEPLSDRCRTLFRQKLLEALPEALEEIPARVWQQRWVTHSQAAGSGENVLRYLSRYVFKTATGNRKLRVLPNGRLRWRYRNSKTRAWLSVDLEPFEFIRRFLQHVLPRGFHRVRRFGWLHPGQRRKFKRVQALLGQEPRLTPAEQKAWQPEGMEEAPEDKTPEDMSGAAMSCPRCGGELELVGRWRAATRPPGLAEERAPP